MEPTFLPDQATTIDIKYLFDFCAVKIAHQSHEIAIIYNDPRILFEICHRIHIQKIHPILIHDMDDSSENGDVMSFGSNVDRIVTLQKWQTKVDIILICVPDISHHEKEIHNAIIQNITNEGMIIIIQPGLFPMNNKLFRTGIFGSIIKSIKWLISLKPYDINFIGVHPPYNFVIGLFTRIARAIQRVDWADWGYAVIRRHLVIKGWTGLISRMVLITFKPGHLNVP
jgi:hypothetical protein